MPCYSRSIGDVSAASNRNNRYHLTNPYYDAFYSKGRIKEGTTMRNRFYTDHETLLWRKLFREAREDKVCRRLWWALAVLYIVVVAAIVLLVWHSDNKKIPAEVHPLEYYQTNTVPYPNTQLDVIGTLPSPPPQDLVTAERFILSSMLDRRNSVKRLVPPQLIGER